MEQIDILNCIHETFRSVFMDGASFFFEYAFKVELIWIVLALYLMRERHTRTMGIVLLFAMIIEIGIVYPMKLAFDELRPYQEYAVEALITTHSTSSFPSSHAAMMFCGATAIAIFDRRKGAMLFLLAIFVSFTRMYMYAHYPSDILAGAAIGIASAFIAALIYLRTGPKTVYVRVREEEKQ